jgi:hypothetical protein
MGRGGAATGAGDRLHAVKPQPASIVNVKHRRHRIDTTCEMAAVFSTPRLLSPDNNPLTTYYRTKTCSADITGFARQHSQPSMPALQARLAQNLQRTPAAHETDDQHHKRDDQQHMDESA